MRFFRSKSVRIEFFFKKKTKKFQKKKIALVIMCEEMKEMKVKKTGRRWISRFFLGSSAWDMACIIEDCDRACCCWLANDDPFNSMLIIEKTRSVDHQTHRKTYQSQSIKSVNFFWFFFHIAFVGNVRPAGQPARRGPYDCTVLRARLCNVHWKSVFIDHINWNIINIQ